MRRIGVVAVVVLLAAAAGGVWGQGRPQKCEEQIQCEGCIQTLGCVWCTNPSDNKDNCRHAASINITDFCDAADLQNPVNKIEVLQDDELTGAQEKTGTTSKRPDDIVQLQPQRVKLYLRKDVPQRVNINYQRARDYPLDLYYLMDLSNSMQDDKEDLASVGNTLADTMKKLTTEFQVGFGSFVDKVILPFTDKEYCEEPPCNPPYSFRNDMPLSQDYAQFTERVNNSKIASNVDHPEGGFDALMQAMVCKEEIGWRDVARRILVYSTDAKFHHAGDGRLGGVVIPNDEKCHLNSQGEYTDYDKYDYPSIGHINKVAKDKNINIIFAVLDHGPLYQELSEKYIEMSSYGFLKTGSKHVVKLIEKQYNSISGGVTLTDNSTSDIDIKYYSACKGDEVIQTIKCDNITENDTVTFEVEITAKKCPADGMNSIVEVKTLEDKVILEIEFLCSCNCTDSGNSTASECQDRGFLVCGACQCHEGFYGEHCQCAASGVSPGTSNDDDTACMASKTDTEPCSGQGKCICGECKCFGPHVTGKYCQCNERKCKGPKGDVCSGNGRCDCDRCVCNDGYNGTLCRCPQKDCINPQSSNPDMKLECSGHGWCDCGKCRCDQHENVIYTGQYCQDCPSCGKGKCGQFRDCVQCDHFGIGPLQPDCNECEKSEAVDSLDEQLAIIGSRLCTFEDEQGCLVKFTYRYHETDNKDKVFVQKERKCPEAAPILSIVFGLIGAIVLIGVATLIAWKALTTYHDRREYAKFENERKNAQFGAEVNPLYVGATTVTQNPTFGGQEEL